MSIHWRSVEGFMWKPQTFHIDDSSAIVWGYWILMWKD